MTASYLQNLKEFSILKMMKIFQHFLNIQNDQNIPDCLELSIVFRIFKNVQYVLYGLLFQDCLEIFKRIKTF